MFMNKRRVDIILKASLLVMWIQCAIWVATVSTSPVATDSSADASLSPKTASLIQKKPLAAASGKPASNNTAGSKKSVSAKPPTTTKSSRFLDDFGELPGVPKDDDDDYDSFLNTTAKTTTVRVPTQEKEGAVDAFQSLARPSVNGDQNLGLEAGNASVANNTSDVLKKSISGDTGSVNRTSAASSPGKNSTTKTSGVEQVAASSAGEINSKKLPATKDLKFPKDHEKLSKLPNDKDKLISTANKTAAVKTPIQQRVEVSESLPEAYPPVEEKQKPTVRNGNGTKINTVLSVSKTKDSQADGVKTNKKVSTTSNVTGNGIKPLRNATVASKLKFNNFSKTNKSNTTSSVSKDRQDNASVVKTSPNRTITTAEHHTATGRSIKDVSLKTDVSSNSTTAKANVASIQTNKPAVAVSNVTRIGNITHTKNQTSKALKFKTVLKIDKSDTTLGISKDKAAESENLKRKKQPAPSSNILGSGSSNKANNHTSEASNIKKTPKADKSVSTSNVTKDKTNSAVNVKSNKTLTITSNVTGTNNVNKAKNNISTSLKLKNTMNLDKSGSLSIVMKGKENNVGKLNSKPPANTTTKTNNQTAATLKLISVLKTGKSNSTTSATEDKRSNAGNIKNKKQPATPSNVSGTGSSSKTINRTLVTSDIKASLKANKSNTPSNVAKEKNVDSLKGNKPSAKTSNTTGTGNTSKTNNHIPASESIKATMKTIRLNATFNALNAKENTVGNAKMRQSVINLNMTKTGNNITKTNNQTSTILTFKNIFKNDKSSITSDLTKDKRNSKK